MDLSLYSIYVGGSFSQIGGQTRSNGLAQDGGDAALTAKRAS
jgi:hypothetical protein